MIHHFLVPTRLKQKKINNPKIGFCGGQTSQTIQIYDERVINIYTSDVIIEQKLYYSFIFSLKEMNNFSFENLY